MSAPINAVTAGDARGVPGRPVRFADPARNAAYWARIDRNTAKAPPLTDEQRATIRAAFHQPTLREAA